MFTNSSTYSYFNSIKVRLELRNWAKPSISAGISIP